MTERLITYPERNARQALDAILHRARHDCAAFGGNLPWDAPMWDVTEHCPRPTNKSHSTSKLYFTTHEGGTSKSMVGRTALAEPFGSLIKTLVRLKQDNSPQTMDPLARIINVARDLELELRDRNGDPCQLLHEDFDAAAIRIVRRSNSKTTQYRLGCALEEIGAFIDRHALTPVRIDWRNTLKRVSNNRDRTTPHAEEARRKNLPETEILDAFAEIWNAVEQPGDVIRMGVMTILHCAPWRIVEALSVAETCERTEEKEDARGVVKDRNGNPVERYGIAYWKEKSGEPDTKWIPTVMVETAKRAVNRIRESTESARQLARWLYDNPGRAWLPGPDGGPDQLFTTSQVAKMFGVVGQTQGLAWLNWRKVPISSIAMSQVIQGSVRRVPRRVVRREDLEAALLREMPVVPENACEAPLHERLLIVHRGTFHDQKGTNPCLLELVTDQHIRDFIGGRAGVKSGFERIIDRPDLSARTHQLRHWLNTLAQKGGVEQALIARWSGRDDIAQNAAYDHLTATELAEVVRDLMADGKVLGALASAHVALPPADRSAFREAVLETAHVTDIGFCLQNWNTSPCPEFGACANCGASAVVKGDEKQKDRASTLRDDNVWIVGRLEAEMDEGTLGASNHYKAASDMVAALDRIIVIHNDPQIPDGTIVQHNATSPVHYAGKSFRDAA